MSELPVSELSYTGGTSGTTLLGDTIGANLDRAVATWPDHEALVDVPSGGHWAYAQFGSDADKLASALFGAGVVKGDRTMIARMRSVASSRRARGVRLAAL